MSGGGGNRNQRLEELQEQTLEDEIKQREQLEADLEARKRLRRLGGRRGQLRFLGPQQRAQERGQRSFTPAAPPPRPIRSRSSRRGETPSQRRAAEGGGRDASPAGVDAGDLSGASGGDVF